MRDTSTLIQYTCTTEVVLIQIIIFQLKMLKNSSELIHETNVKVVQSSKFHFALSWDMHDINKHEGAELYRVERIQ